MKEGKLQLENLEKNSSHLKMKTNQKKNELDVWLQPRSMRLEIDRRLKVCKLIYEPDELDKGRFQGHASIAVRNQTKNCNR